MMPGWKDRTPAEWGAAENILCVRLDNLGDVMMTSPAFRAIKESNQKRRITLLASPVGAKIGRLIPEVDDVIVYEAPWMKSSARSSSSQQDYAMAEKLKAARFDGAVIFTVYSQSPLPAAFICYLANIPLRLAHCRENPYQLLTHWVKDTHPEDNGRHEVRRQLDLVSAVGFTTQNEKLSMETTHAGEEKVLALLKKLGIDPAQPWIVIHPGASAPSRRYPPELYAVVAQLLNRKGYQIIFTGSKSEITLVEDIRLKMQLPSISLAGILGLGEFGALLKTAPLLISNNSGPVHIAAAAGTPIVDIYALTNPQHTPWMVPNRVLNFDVPCKYCYKSICPEGHHNCLRKVLPQQVVIAAEELITEENKIEVENG
jgi:lipopolysaccharide heptosyltransferase II